MNGRYGFDLYAKIFVLCARIRLLRDSCPRIRKQARRTQDYSHLTGRAGWIVSACSGHGFKLAPLIADGVAAAIAGERDPVGVNPWAAGRAATLE